MSGFDLVWIERRRDWRWLWLRKKTVRHQAPITPHDMSKITALRPSAPWFAKELEDQGVELVDWTAE